MGCATLASSSSSSRPSWPRVIFCLMQPPRRFDDIISMIVNQCALYVEEQRYVTPAEKHCLLRVMTYGLYLMDGEGPQNSQFNIFKSKKINLSRFSKLFKVRSSQKQKKALRLMRGAAVSGGTAVRRHAGDSGVADQALAPLRPEGVGGGGRPRDPRVRARLAHRGRARGQQAVPRPLLQHGQRDPRHPEEVRALHMDCSHHCRGC